ncbi:MAG: CSLREA domain-containing protein, partial [Actinomycetia bacterium]|nr:CSLREA domain-containing protein [Actinomycetes bacterium]
LAATFRVNGRSGDPGGRLSTLFLQFKDNVGTNLNDAQADALIERLHIYRDTGSGVFESDGDTLVQTVEDFSLLAGNQTVILPAADPNVLVFGPSTFFVVAEITADASQQAPNALTVTLVPAGGLLDAEGGILLQQESPQPFTSQIFSTEPSFVVNSTTDARDDVPGDGTCSTSIGECTLRAAVMEANAFPGDDRIVLPEGTFTITILASDNDALSGDLDIDDANGAVTVIGQGADKTIIDANNFEGAFQVLNFASLTLEGMSLTGGNVNPVVSSGVNGALTVDKCAFYDNTAAATNSVGIQANGALTVTNSAFYDNTTGTQGGVIGTGTSATSIDLTQVTIVNNSGTDGRGVFINSVPAVADIDSCTIAGSSVGVRRGNGTVNIRNSVVSGEDADTENPVNLVAPNFLGDADLLPLGDNGGPTLTAGLAPSSPAIDAGSCNGLTEDQRGESRPVDIPGAANFDDGCDIGAFEAKLGQTQDRIEVPVRWCGLIGSPSIDDPADLDDPTITTANDVL